MNNGILVLAVTNNYLFTAANVILGIDKYCEGVFKDILIFVEDVNKLDLREKAAIRKLTDKSRILLRNADSILKYINLKNCKIDYFVEKYSIMPFVKLMIPMLFSDDQLTGCSDYGYAMWLDSDICINGPFEELFEMDGLKCCMGSYAKPLLNHPNWFPQICDSDIKPNGGMLLYHRDFYDKSVKNIKEYFNTLNEEIELLIKDGALGIEELAITLICKIYNIQLNIVSQEYNFFPRSSRCAFPKIIHSLGKKQKFWNNGLVNIAFPEWTRNNNQWLSLLVDCGVKVSELSKYDHCEVGNDTLGKLIRQDVWSNFWNNIAHYIKFSHTSLYCPTRILDDHFRYYFKSLTNKDAYFEIVSDRVEFNVALVVKKSLERYKDIEFELNNISKTFLMNFEVNNEELVISVRGLNKQNLGKSLQIFVERTVHTIEKKITTATT